MREEELLLQKKLSSDQDYPPIDIKEPQQKT